MTGFVVYRLKDEFAGVSLVSLENAVDLEAWSGRPPQRHYTVAAVSGVSALLYLLPSGRDEPEWSGLLRAGFGQELPVPPSSSPGALLLVRVVWRDVPRAMAFCLGSGRHLLRSDAYVRKFGLRVALNVVFEGDTENAPVDASKLRSIDAKRVSSSTLRLRHQAARTSALEAFDLDRDRDLLRGVTGKPRDPAAWGTNVTGTDSFACNADFSFDELPELCERLLDAQDSSAYQSRFGWVDDVSPVKEPELLAIVEAEVVFRLTTQEVPQDLELAVPQLVDWEEIAGFELPYERRTAVVRPELRLRDLVSVLSTHGRLADIDVAALKRITLHAVDHDGQMVHKWPAWRCLIGEVKINGRTYVLDEGEVYEVSADYMSTLDAYLTEHLPESALELPAADARWTEGKYNEEAAAASHLLLLDKKLVRVNASTSPIEICDLLSGGNQLVHVKRDLGSSSLSHLFAQGFVSADLIQTSSEFKEKALGVAQSKISSLQEDEQGYWARRLGVFQGDIAPSGIEIVYAIVADWDDRPFVDRLPFFSKVNLRRCVMDLRQRGFVVTHRRIVRSAEKRVCTDSR